MKSSITLLFSILFSVTTFALDAYSSPLDTITVYPTGFPFSFSSNGIFLKTHVNTRSNNKDSSYWVSSDQRIVTGRIDSTFRKDIVLNSLKVDDTLILTWWYQYKSCTNCLTNRYYGTIKMLVDTVHKVLKYIDCHDAYYCPRQRGSSTSDDYVKYINIPYNIVNDTIIANFSTGNNPSSVVSAWSKSSFDDGINGQYYSSTWYGSIIDSIASTANLTVSSLMQIYTKGVKDINGNEVDIVIMNNNRIVKKIHAMNVPTAVRVFDLLGREYACLKDTSNQSVRVNINHLPSGYYIVTIDNYAIKICKE